MVVEKFRAAIEKRSFVFVAFDDELFSAAEPVAAIVEIRDYATDKEIRPAPGDMENPGEHGGGGSLAVRSCNDDRGMAADKIVLEKLRHRAVRDFFVEDDFQFRISARDHVADDDQIGDGL